MNKYDDFIKCVVDSIDNGHYVDCVACDEGLNIALMKRSSGNTYTYFIVVFMFFRGFYPVRCFFNLDNALSAYNALTFVE